MPGWGSSACAMSTDGVYCIIPTDNVYITELFLYKRTGDTFNLIDHPAHSPAADYYPSVALSNDGTYLALACSFAYTWVYKRTGDTYNRISSGATIGPGYPVKVDLNSDGSFLTIATNNAVYMFKRDETDVYNETTPDNATNLGANVKSVKFSDDGKQIVVSTNTDGPVLARFTLEQGLSYSSTSVSSTYDAGTKKMTIAIARSLSNNSTTETVTINEIGVYAQLTTGNYSMLNREKLSSPVALAPSAVATVTFNIEIVYPG
jgi:WD40 repeat protein